jgi:hypothetical protein
VHPFSILSHLYFSVGLLSRRDLSDDRVQALNGCLFKGMFQRYFLSQQAFFLPNSEFIGQLQFKLVFYQLIQKFNSYFMINLGR